MNRENIIAPIQNGLSYAVGKLQMHLFDNLPWVEKGYGLASDGFRESAEKVTLTVPEVYVGQGRYQDVLPDGHLMGHFFFYADGAEKVEEFNPFSNSKMSCPVSIIVWVDLDKINAQLGLGYSHRFTDELIDEALGVLAQHGHFQPQSVERKAVEVWKNWTVGRGVLYYGDRKEYAQTQVFKHPEAGFRISGTLYYDKACQPLPDIAEGSYTVPANTGHHHNGIYAPVNHTHPELETTPAAWGSITGLLTDQSDLMAQLGAYALSGHTHDYSTVFASITHDHDAVYAPLVHTHDYAPSSHTHDYSLVYAPLSHHHNDLYYTIQEVDDYLTGYALAGHTHDYSSVFAPLVHDHDEDYSQLGHTHTQYAAGDHVHNFSEILVTPTTLAGYGITDAAPLVHNHDSAYAAIGHTHDYSAVYAPLAHNHDAAYASITHNHDSAYSALNHAHAGVYEPVFTKNTGFNKNLGTTAGTVSEGNHVHSVFSTGVAGFVPARAGATTTKFLREDGTWVVPTDTNTTYTAVSDAEMDNTASTTGRLITGQRINSWATRKGFLTALPTHDHNTLYYTEAEVDALLAGKSDTTHTHDYSAVYAPLNHSHNDLYYTETEVDTFLSGKSDTGHTHDYSAVYAPLSHSHTGVYEPVFSKNSGFNLNVGTTIGTVAAGNHTHDYSAVYAVIAHTHTFASLTSKPTTLAGYGITDAATSSHTHDYSAVYAPLSHNHTGVYEPVFTKNTGFNLNVGTTAGTVAAGNHTHDYSAVYAPLSHNHDATYAAITHNHDTAYSAIGHNHDSSYAPVTHNHDATYAALAHTHNQYKHITIEAVTATENILWFYTESAITIANIRYAMEGQVYWNISVDTNPFAGAPSAYLFNSDVTLSADTHNTLTPDTVSVAAGSYLRIVTSAAIADTVLHLTLKFS